MYKNKLLLLIPVYYLFFCNINAQTPSQCKWVGTVSAAFNNEFIPQRAETLTGSVVFEIYISLGGYEVYKLTSGLFTWSVAGGTLQNGCVVRSNSITFSAESEQIIGGELTITDSGNYYGSIGFTELGQNFTAVHTDCQNSSADEPPILYGLAIGIFDSTFLDEDVMTGSMVQGTVTFSWNLNRVDEGEVKLLIESPQYENWLPAAAKTENEPGSLIQFDARLIKEDGSTPCKNAEKFIFELLNVSNEPGVALNFPKAENAKDDYDIYFSPDLLAPGDILSADKLKLETKGGSSALAPIYSFDWGAYATLKVTAVMKGGNEITGYLSGHPEITEITLPGRSGNSKIADKWKQDRGVASLSDDDDNENTPEGDGHNGDGFTLYEEYRGFYENGSHIFGDPKEKDLFVHASMDRFKPGLLYFASLTGINVHYDLTRDEFNTETRLINFNHNEGPHQTDQHGIFIDKTNDIGKSYSPYGPPKYVDTVNMSIALGEGSGLTGTVAHEMGHACRIPHHGPNNDKRTVWDSFFVGAPNTGEGFVVFTEDGLGVDARWENDRPYRQYIRGKKYVAVWGAQHSGFSDCVMRYEVAFAYIPGPGSASSIRYIINGDERSGSSLCDVGVKTDIPGGINHSGRSPRPRHGDAVNGGCVSFICVNDKYH